MYFSTEKDLKPVDMSKLNDINLAGTKEKESDNKECAYNIKTVGQVRCTFLQISD